MKKCKSCQSEIDTKATKCPHCQTDQRGWFKKHPILTVILVIILIGIIGSASGGSRSSTPSTSVTSTSKTAEVKPTKAEEIEGVTMAKFNEIKEGMGYEKVVSILGFEGETLSSSELGGYKTVMYQWKGSAMLSNMNATFQNGKMMSKAQFGLK